MDEFAKQNEVDTARVPYSKYSSYMGRRL